MKPEVLSHLAANMFALSKERLLLIKIDFSVLLLCTLMTWSNYINRANLSFGTKWSSSFIPLTSGGHEHDADVGGNEIYMATTTRQWAQFLTCQLSTIYFFFASV